MKNVSIYLAGPIDGVSERLARGWREDAGTDLPMGVVLFSPAHAYFGASKATAREVCYLNRMQIAATDAMIANCLDGFGFGTVREIEFAVSQHKPVVVMESAGLAQQSLMMHDVVVVEDWDTALQVALEEVQKLRGDQNMLPGMQILRFGPHGIEPEEEEEG